MNGPAAPPIGYGPWDVRPAARTLGQFVSMGALGRHLACTAREPRPDHSGLLESHKVTG